MGGVENGARWGGTGRRGRNRRGGGNFNPDLSLKKKEIAVKGGLEREGAVQQAEHRLEIKGVVGDEGVTDQALARRRLWGRRIGAM